MPYKDPEVRRLKQREASRRYRERHPEENRARVSQWKKDHPEHVREYKKKYKKEHPEYRKRRWKAYYANQRESRNKKRKQHYEKTKQHTLAVCKRYRETHKEQIRKYFKGRRALDNERLKNYYRKQKQIVVDAYGGKCFCCGETHFEFLTIDHIHGGGRKDRAKRTGSGFYVRLVKEGFPKDKYRLACMNCNFALGKYGHCPHRVKSDTVESPL